MKLIEADKVEQAIKDYWKAQVDRAPIPKSTEEYNAYVNCLDAILERNDGLLKAIDELPSAEPDTTTYDSISAETGENDGDKTSGDCISRQQAIDTLRKMQTYKLFAGDDMILIDKAQVQTELMMLPSAQPERTEYIPETKAVRSKRDCVDLSERVTTTFYDDEHEEWSQKTVTIRDVLDSVCDEYTVLPSAQPERKTGRWIEMSSTNHTYKCSVCGRLLVNVTDGKNNISKHYPYCHCGAKMEGGEQE